MQADNLAGFEAGVVGDAAGEFAALFIENADDVSALEFAPDFDHTSSQQTRLPFNESAPGAFVDYKGSLNRGSEGDPAAFAREAFSWQEERADFLARDHAVDYRGKLAACDDRRASRMSCYAGSLDLCFDAAATEAWFPVGP